MSKPSKLLLPALAVAAVLLQTACDNTVDPFVASAEEPFAIYGYLDSEADTQFVRISPVIDAFGFVHGDTLDAHVELLNLTSGTRVRLQDSSAVLPNQRRAYFYYTRLTPARGSAYRLDVFNSRGDTTQAFARMPDGEQVYVEDPETEPGTRIVQSIRWEGVSSVRNVELHYFVRVGSSNTSVSIPYAAPRLNEPDVTLVDLQRDRDRVFAELPPGSSRVRLLRVAASAELLSPEWEFGRESGPIFFGSIGQVHKEWTLPDSIVTRLGYVVAGS